jgi:hypothetical protein
MFCAACLALTALGATCAASVRADETGPAREQVAAASPDGESSSRESVLVSFASTAPAGVENDIAREHNLELVSRLTLPTVGLRIVRYSVPDARPVAKVLARLREDRRVSAAQLNLEYRQDPALPDTVVGALPKPQLAGPRKSSTGAKAVATLRERREAELFGERRRPTRRAARIAAGDVLAGGL